MNVLNIGTWSSKCENCGKGCDPNEKEHKTVLGYSKQEQETPGCGVRYTHVTTNYTELVETVKKMRPDLIFFGWGE